MIFVGSHSVSPVVASFRPTAAAMSPGAHFLDVLALVGVHLQDAAEALLLALDRVVDRVAGIDDAGIDAEEHELADEWVGHDLEREARERLVVGRPARTFGAVVQLAGHRRNVRRRRHVVDHRVEHRLHALVLERGAAQHRHDLARDGAHAQALLDFVDGELAVSEVAVHQLLVRFGGALEHLFAPLRSELGEVGGNVAHVVLHALRRIVPVDRLHLHEIDDAGELVLRADRHLDHHRIRLQARLHLVVDLEEVGADAVHLVDEREPRHLVLVRLAPDGFRLRLHAADRVVHHARAIEHAHRALDLDREVDVSRRVDDVDPVLGIAAVHPLPEARRGGRRDRDAALALLLHPVHDGRAVVHLAHLVGDAGVEEDAFGGRGLAGINVRTDADVAIPVDWGSSWHILL